MTAVDPATELSLLRHHGDSEVAPGLVDLAVNVRPGAPPGWLHDRIAAADLTRYPDPAPARAAVAARHGRPPAQVLLTAGSAEAFVLLARALTPRRAVVVHPQFTEPELALRAAGHDVERVLLPWPFRLDPGAIPDDADLVVLGNPTNPTSVGHPADAVRALARPGRVLVVDEAFADCTPGEPGSLASLPQLPGVVVVRSLTKTWGLPGLRAGYLLADADMVAVLAEAQPAWPVSAPALAACLACCTPEAVAEATDWAHQLVRLRAHWVALLGELPGVRVAPDPQASFLLLRGRPGLHPQLRSRGFAARRGDTFPGLGPEYLRVAVRDAATGAALAAALRELA